MNIKMGWESRRIPTVQHTKNHIVGEGLVKVLRGLERASMGTAWIKPKVRAVEVSRQGLTPGELQPTAGTENGAVP